QAVAQDEDALAVDGGMALENGDRCGGVRQVLVAEREPTGVPDLGGVRMSDLVKPQHGHPTAGQPPGDVLERLVAPDRLVAVKRPRSGEEHQTGPRAVSTGHR